MPGFYDQQTMDDVAGADEGLSKYNSASLMNMRLNNLWILVNEHARKAHYSEWSAILDRVWCELASDVKKDSDEEKTKDAILRYSLPRRIYTIPSPYYNGTSPSKQIVDILLNLSVFVLYHFNIHIIHLNN